MDGEQSGSPPRIRQQERDQAIIQFGNKIRQQEGGQTTIQVGNGSQAVAMCSGNKSRSATRSDSRNVVG